MATNDPDRVRVDQRRRLPILPILIGLAIFLGLAAYFYVQHDRKTRVADAEMAAPSTMADLPNSKADPALGNTPEAMEATKGRGVQGGPGSGEGLQRENPGL